MILIATDSSTGGACELITWNWFPIRILLPGLYHSVDLEYLETVLTQASEREREKEREREGVGETPTHHASRNP